MANTYELLATVTVGSGGTSTIDFTSIPSTYKDLCLKISTRTSNTGSARDYFALRFNNSGSAEYGWRWLAAYDSNSLTSNNNTGQTYGKTFVNPDSTATSSMFGNADIYIGNYAGSTHKSVSGFSTSENNSTTTWMLSIASTLWSNTSAINQITLYPGDISGNFVQYSTASLYGIKNS